MARITLDFNDPANRRLNELASDPAHDSIPKVIQNALRVYDFLYDQTKKGAKVFVINNDSTQELAMPHQEAQNQGDQPDQPRTVWDRINSD